MVNFGILFSHGNLIDPMEDWLENGNNTEFETSSHNSRHFAWLSVFFFQGDVRSKILWRDHNSSANQSHQEHLLQAAFTAHKWSKLEHFLENFGILKIYILGDEHNGWKRPGVDSSAAAHSSLQTYDWQSKKQRF